MDQPADSILNLITVYGMNAVVAAAVRTLPVTTFAESNEAVGRYKDEVVAQRQLVNKLKEEIVVLNRLITNLEGEIRRLAAELREKSVEEGA